MAATCAVVKPVICCVVKPEICAEEKLRIWSVAKTLSCAGVMADSWVPPILNEAIWAVFMLSIWSVVSADNWAELMPASCAVVTARN